jgi:hypothetical protein
MEALIDAPPFPVVVSVEPGPAERAATLAKFVESFASVIAGLHEVYTPESGERVTVACHNGILGYSLAGGPALLWLSLRSLSARHGKELRAATVRRAAAIARLSKYVAADVISEDGCAPSTDSGVEAAAAPVDFELAGSAHTERGIFRCGTASEALQRAESAARMGGCWAVLLTPPAALSAAGGASVTAASLEVVAITGAEEGGVDDGADEDKGADLAQDCGRDAGVPWLLPSQVRRLRDIAALLLNSASAGSEPRSEAAVDADPHMQLLAWGPAALCVGAIGASLEPVLLRAGGESKLESRRLKWCRQEEEF